MLIISSIALNLLYLQRLSNNEYELAMKLNKIKEVLDRKGISQTWLGKSFSTVNAYSSNRVQPPLETLFEIAKILQVNIQELINAEDKCQKQRI